MKTFLQLMWAVGNQLKKHNNLMQYFDVILLSYVIRAFGPNVTRRVTYVHVYVQNPYFITFTL